LSNQIVVKEKIDVIGISRAKWRLTEPDAAKRKRVENQVLASSLGWTLDDDAATDIERARGQQHCALPSCRP
jgi:hypothetical protein